VFNKQNISILIIKLVAADDMEELLPNLNEPVAVSKGMWAVKPCFNKILQAVEYKQL